MESCPSVKYNLVNLDSWHNSSGCWCSMHKLLEPSLHYLSVVFEVVMKDSANYTALYFHSRQLTLARIKTLYDIKNGSWSSSNGWWFGSVKIAKKLKKLNLSNLSNYILFETFSFPGTWSRVFSFLGTWHDILNLVLQNDLGIQKSLRQTGICKSSLTFHRNRNMFKNFF